MVEMRAVQVDDTATLPKAFWVTLAIFTCFFTIYGLIHFAIFLDGFYHTCNQFRRSLETLLGIHGTAIAVIHSRLSCQSIFDFMDYMQPNSNYGFRDGFIYTGADLIIGILASCFAWLLFAMASFINIKRARIQE